MASQLFADWDVLTDMRIATHEWALESNDAPLREYFEVASRTLLARAFD